VRNLASIFHPSRFGTLWFGNGSIRNLNRPRAPITDLRVDSDILSIRLLICACREKSKNAKFGLHFAFKVL